jgi:hypothetical protein
MRYGIKTEFFCDERRRMIRFKSKHEYMWYTWFERLGLQWEYEPVTFLHPEKTTKGNALTYTPDFGLECNAVFVEVKTYGKQYVRNLLGLCNKPLILAFGHPLKCDLHVMFPEDKSKSHYFTDFDAAYRLARNGLPSWLHSI